MGQHLPLGGIPCIFWVLINVRLYGRVCNALLILLFIFYIFFRDARQSPVAFYQVVSSLAQDCEIRYLKKVFPYSGEFLFLHVAQCLLDGPGEGIVLFDVAAVKYFYFELHIHPCTKVKHVCFG